MEASDTIYLTPLLVEGCGKTLSKRVTENDVEYIRKDALLEWAKENQEKCFSVVEDDLWQEVIDKINEI